MDEATNQQGGMDPTDHDNAEVERELAEAMDGKTVEQLIDEAQKPDEADGPPADGDNADKPDQVAFSYVRGRVSAVEGDDVFVALQGTEGKNQGVVPLAQFERAPRIGSIMDFVVEREDEAEGLVVLSREGAASRATWDHIHRGTVAEARVVGTNTGGLELELVGGIRAFMPASQVDIHHVDDLETLVGQKLQGVIQEIDRRGKTVVISRRAYLETRRKALEKKLWAELEEGQLRDGTVSSIMDYGAFVDLGGADGLLHVSDLSYTRVDKPGDVVSVGQEVKVKVLKLDPEKKRISLGLKQIQPDPWEQIEGQIKPGDQVTGRVVRLADFGAFVEVEQGVEGLLPASELGWKRGQKVSEVLEEGQVVRLAVLQVDIKRQRLSLSLKEAAGDPWVGAEHKFAKNEVVEGTVRSIVEFGAFIELEPGVEGLVHISALSMGRVQKVEDVLNVAQKERFRVIEVDEDERRISLSLKAVDHPEATSDSAAGGSGKKQAPPAKAAAKRKPRKDLKGGMGAAGGLGIGLGDLKL